MTKLELMNMASQMLDMCAKLAFNDENLEAAEKVMEAVNALGFYEDADFEWNGCDGYCWFR